MCAIFINKKNLSIHVLSSRNNIKYKKQNSRLFSDFSRADLNAQKNVEMPFRVQKNKMYLIIIFTTFIKKTDILKKETLNTYLKEYDLIMN